MEDWKSDHPYNYLRVRWCWYCWQLEVESQLLELSLELAVGMAGLGGWESQSFRSEIWSAFENLGQLRRSGVYRSNVMSAQDYRALWEAEFGRLDDPQTQQRIQEVVQALGGKKS